jgi:hypothetical protein
VFHQRIQSLIDNPQVQMTVLRKEKSEHGLAMLVDQH